MADTIDADTGEITSGTELSALDNRSGSLVGTMVRAEIEAQVATARAYPRSIEKSMKMLKSIVTIDAESAQECIYALPRGGKPIRGPSVRFAEALFVSWGNNLCEAEVTHVDREEKVVIARGSYRDLETGAWSRVSVRRRIVDKHGKLFPDDLIILTGNAACSIARRNVILAGVPKPVWRGAMEAVERTIAGKAETLSATREAAVKSFAMWGVKPDQVYAALGVKGLEDIQLDHVVTLRGMYSAIKNEEATVEEVFNLRVGGGKTEGVQDPLGAGDKAQPETEKLKETAKETAKTKTETKPAEPTRTSQIGDGDFDNKEPADSGRSEAAAGGGAQSAAAVTGAEGASHTSAPEKSQGSATEGRESGHDNVADGKEAAANKRPPAEKAAASTAKASEPPAPKTEADYKDHVLAYIAAATSASALEEMWKSKPERGFRTAVNITTELMSELKALVTAKVNVLKGEAT